MSGRPAKHDKLAMLKVAKEYYTKILAVISDIEAGKSEREACAAHAVPLIRFRNDTLYKKTFGCTDRYAAVRVYLSPYEHIYEDVTHEKLDLVSICTLPTDLDTTVALVLQESLNDQEFQVLQLYYCENMTFTDISEYVKLSISRVTQIYRRALRKLRRDPYRRRIQEGDVFIAEVQQQREAYKLRKLEEARKECIAEVDAKLSSFAEYEARAGKIGFVDAPIEELELSTRAYTALRRWRIDTVYKLRERIESGKLRSLRGIGESTEENILRAIADYAARCNS